MPNIFDKCIALVSIDNYEQPNTSTVKLCYNKHTWDCLVLLVIAVIRYNHEDLCTINIIWDHKLKLHFFDTSVNLL